MVGKGIIIKGVVLILGVSAIGIAAKVVYDNWDDTSSSPVPDASDSPDTEASSTENTHESYSGVSNVVVNSPVSTYISTSKPNQTRDDTHSVTKAPVVGEKVTLTHGNKPPAKQAGSGSNRLSGNTTRRTVQFKKQTTRTSTNNPLQDTLNNSKIILDQIVSITHAVQNYENTMGTDQLGNYEKYKKEYITHIDIIDRDYEKISDYTTAANDLANILASLHSVEAAYKNKILFGNECEQKLSEALAEIEQIRAKEIPQIKRSLQQLVGRKDD